MLASLFCASCFEDKSNTEVKTLNPIVIENLNLAVYDYKVLVGDTLKLEPLIYCEGVPDTELSFLWELCGGVLTEPQVIDTTMFLCAPITVTPMSSPYTLRLTITDETTGICRIETFNITVQNNAYGEGILVAETKDGVNTDFSLLRSRELTSQLDMSDRRLYVTRDIIATNNGAPLPGLLLDALGITYGTNANRSLTVLTTDCISRIDYTTFVKEPGEQDAELFPVAPPYVGQEYTHGALGYVYSYSELISINGKVSDRGVQNNGREFSYTLYPAGVDDYDITMIYTDPDPAFKYGV